VFVRGKIDKTLSLENSSEKTVRVFCVDIGVYALLSSHNIYVLPEQFKFNVLKTVCVTLILANLKPLADEPNFPKPLIPKTKRFVDNKIYTGKVLKVFHSFPKPKLNFGSAFGLNGRTRIKIIKAVIN
jgi:hypothetical protein